MYNYLQIWVGFLNSCEAIVGIPLCVGGAVLAILGWRLWRFASVVSLALLGGIAGHVISGQDGFDFMYTGGGAAFGILIGVALYSYAATVIGGVIGGCIVSSVLHALSVTGPLLWLGAAVGLAGAVAFAYTNQHRVIVGVTAIEGAVLLVSGFTVMLHEWPSAYHYMSTTAMHHAVMLPFFVLVPAVIGICLQLADSNRSHSKSIRS